MSKRFLSALIASVLIASLLAGCNAENPNEKINYAGPVFHSAYAFHSFAVTPDAEVYGVSSGQPVGKYASGGEPLDTYPGTEGFSELCYSNGFLYAYDGGGRGIAELNVDTKEIRGVMSMEAEGFLLCMAMAASNGKIFALVNTAGSYPIGPDFILAADYDGYIDFGLEFIEIDAASGAVTKHPEVKTPVALYMASGGTLYIYTRPEQYKYSLYPYDAKSGNLGKAAQIEDVEYTTNFIREGNLFVYISRNYSLCCKNMKSKNVTVCLNNAGAYSGLAFHNGNIVYANMAARDGANAFRNVLLGKSTLRLLDENGQPIVSKGSLTTYGAAIEAVSQLTGISAVDVSETVGWEGLYDGAILAGLMAGDSEVDIYGVSVNQLDFIRGVRKNGFYHPLNGSDGIRSYFDRCFGWVGESVTDSNGNIWALPVMYDIPALFYVPENMARFDIDPQDLAYLDGYIGTLNRINPVKGDGYFTDFWHIFEPFAVQYDSFCRDAGVYDYDTALYRKVFETLYSGWRYYPGWTDPDGNPAHHPVMQYDFGEMRSFLGINGGVRGTDNDSNPDCMIFMANSMIKLFTGMGLNAKGKAYSSESGSIDMTEYISRWRAAPMPRISEDIQYNYSADGRFYFINPNSKNKELAVEYLEAFTGNMFDLFMNMGGNFSAPLDKFPMFIFKDPAEYEGYFDMSIPLFADIYEIYKNAACGEQFLMTDMYTQPSKQYIYDYQDGKITLNEASAARQREVDMWLYE